MASYYNLPILQPGPGVFSLKKPFYFETIIDLQEVAEIVQRGSVYFSSSFPSAYIFHYNIKTQELTLVECVCVCGPDILSHV